jgi:hypothetical protein
VQPWLPALAFKGLWQVGGITALAVAQAVIATATTAITYLVARRWVSALSASLVAVWFTALSQPTVLRTEQLALLIAAGLLLLLQGRRWWLAPLLVIAWANVHGSVVLGVALVVAASLGLVRGADQIARASIRLRAVVVAASVVALVVSPLGIDVVDYLRSINGVQNIEAITPVWKPMAPASLRAIGVYAAFVFVLAGWRRTGRSWRELLPLAPSLVLLIAAFGAVRYASWLALALVPELAWAAGAFSDSRRNAARSWALRASAAIAAAAICAGVVLLLPGTPYQRKLARLGVPEHHLVDSIRSDDVVLASPEWADYVHLKTGARVVVDARLERYRPGDLADYLDFRDHADPHLVDRTSPDAVVLHWKTLGEAWPNEPKSQVALRGHGQLRRVARGDYGATYVVSG